MSFTKTIVVGNLGDNPDLRYMADGRPVASFSVCANERRGSGENKTETQTWFRANVFGNSAKAVAEHLQKGDQVYVEGRLKPDMWVGDDGKTRLTLNINTSDVQFLGKRRAAQPAGEPQAAAGEGQPEGDGTSDDIPF